MQDIVLKDIANKLMLEMRFLRDDTELLISTNINTINEKKGIVQFQIQQYGDNAIIDLERMGFKKDDGLYDRVINEYNLHNPVPLKLWK